MPAAATADYSSRADYAPRTGLMVSAAAVAEQDSGKPQQQHHHRRLNDSEPMVGSSAVDVCDFRSAPNAVDHETFVRDAVRLMLEQAVFRGTDRRRPVLNWKSPEELQAAFDFKINRSATTHSHLLRLLEDTIEHSVKTGHPYFINQLFSRYISYIGLHWLLLRL